MMQIYLDIEIDEVFYAPADKTTGTSKVFEIERISFLYKNQEITSIEQLHEIMIKNKQPELIKLYLENINPI